MPGRKGGEKSRERGERERECNNQQHLERERESRDEGTGGSGGRIERLEAVPDGGGRSDTDADADAVIADPAIKGERPTDYALTFDRSCWRRRKEKSILSIISRIYLYILAIHWLIIFDLLFTIVADHYTHRHRSIIHNC